MNIHGRQIAKLLSVSDIVAERVQYEMACGGFDFSECTQTEFNKEARSTYAELVRTKVVLPEQARRKG